MFNIYIDALCNTNQIRMVNDETYDIKSFCKKLSTYNKKSDIDNYINENLPIKLDDNTYL